MPSPNENAPPPATSWTSIVGWRDWKSGQRGMSHRISKVGSQESTQRLLRRALTRNSLTASRMRSNPPETAWARVRPASVKYTRRLRRSKSAMPSSSSSRRTARLTAPWVKCSSSAARLKFSRRAAASKQRSASSEGRRLSLYCDSCSPPMSESIVIHLQQTSIALVVPKPTTVIQ